jgi:hypothetical protein
VIFGIVLTACIMILFVIGIRRLKFNNQMR